MLSPHDSRITHYFISFIRAQQPHVTMVMRGQDLSSKIQPDLYSVAVDEVQLIHNTIAVRVVHLWSASTHFSRHFPNFTNPAKPPLSLSSVAPSPAKVLDRQLHMFGIIKLGARRVDYPTRYF